MLLSVAAVRLTGIANALLCYLALLAIYYLNLAECVSVMFQDGH